MESLLWAGLGVLAASGWFFFLGQLLIHRLSPKLQTWGMILAVSCAASIVALTIITPWIPLPFPILHILGMGLFAVGMWKRIPLPPISVPKLSIPLIFTGVVGSLFAIGALFFPDHSFDSLAYHLPFVQEFATLGTIPFPTVFENWTDYVHVIFPKGVETLYGLATQLHPSFFPVLQVAILMGVILLSAELAKKLGIKREWLAPAFILGLNYLFTIYKAFWVEFALFFFSLALLILLLEESKKQNGTWIIVILTIAMVASKTHAVVFVTAFILIAFFFSRKIEQLAIGIAGAGIGLAITYFPAFIQGYDILHTFQVVQALVDGIPTPFMDRIWIVSLALGRVFAYPLVLFCTLVGIAGVIRFTSLKKIGYAWGTALLAFTGLFLVTSVYFYTYLQLQVYVFAFLGIIAVIAAVTIDRLLDQSLSKRALFVVKMGIGAYFVIGVVIVLLSLGSLAGGTHAGVSHHYAVLKETIPNEPETKLFFMNNINSISYGWEKATVWDYTTFPTLPAEEPCAFFREKGITHIVFWAQNQDMFQVYGKNPEFYTEARLKLKSGECGPVLYDEDDHFGPIIVKINP